MEFITEFFTVFFDSRWVKVVDFVIAFLLVAASFSFVYFIRPMPANMPSPFAPVNPLRQIFTNQEVRFIIMATSIMVAYSILRVLHEMGLV